MSFDILSTIHHQKQQNSKLFFFHRGSLLLGVEGSHPQLREVPQQEQEQGSRAASAAAPQEQVGRERFGLRAARREPLLSAPAPVLVAQPDVPTVQQRSWSNE